MSAARRPPDARSTALADLVLLMLLAPIGLFAVGVVLGTTSTSKGDQTAAFFGAGDQSSAWLWVARASAVFLVAVVVAAAVFGRRLARRAPTDAAAPHPTDPEGR